MRQSAEPIVYLIDHLDGDHGGTERQFLSLLEQLDRVRYEPSLCVLRSSDFIERNSFACPVEVLDMRKIAHPSSVWKILRYARELRRRGVRLVHIFFNDASIIAPPFLKLAGIKVIVSRRDMGYWYTPAALIVLRINRWLVDCFVANCQAVSNRVQEQERVPASKLTVIKNGYRVHYRNGSVKRCTSRIRAFENCTSLIGMVSNLRPLKRVDDLIRAFVIVADRHPKSRLVVAGEDFKFPDGRSLQHELEMIAVRHGVSERVHFLGKLDNVDELLSQLDVGVLCSESEGLSNAIIEYMRAGKPTVCSNVGGNPELIEHGKTGYLFTVGDTQTLAKRISQLLGATKLRARLGRKARDVAVRQFDDRITVSSYMTLYDRLLKSEC